MAAIYILLDEAGAIMGGFANEQSDLPDGWTQELWDNQDPRWLTHVYGRRPRKLLDIFNGINALTNAQKAAVWNDISSGSPPKWSTDYGVNAGSIMTLHFLSVSVNGLSSSEKVQAQIRLVALYVQDNPNYLVNPPFSPTVNVPGDEPNTP